MPNNKFVNKCKLGLLHNFKLFPKMIEVQLVQLPGSITFEVNNICGWVGTHTCMCPCVSLCAEDDNINYRSQTGGYYHRCVLIS